MIDPELSEEIETLRAKKRSKDLRQRGVWSKGFQQSKSAGLILIKDAFDFAIKKQELEKVMRELEDLKNKPMIDTVLGRHRRSTDGSSAARKPPQPKPKPAALGDLPKPKPKKPKGLFTFGFKKVENKEK